MKNGLYTLVAVTLLLTLGSAEVVRAQPTKYAQAGMPFLKIDVGARTAAMGGTYASVAGSADDMFSNPAGLALLEGFDASSTVTNWIADIRHYGGGAAYRFGNLGTFGINLVWMDYGDFRRTAPALFSTDPTDQERGYIDQGTFGVTEYAIGFSYARQITSQFYVGGQIRYASQDLGAVDLVNEFTEEIENVENQVTNIVLDFGTMYYTGFRDLRFGVAVRNFSNQADYYDQRFELPLALDFGMAMDLLSLTSAGEAGQGNSTLTLAVDWQHPRDFGERLHAGLEYGFADTVFLRGGYKFNYDSEGLTAGLGVKAGLGGYGLKAGYAYVDSNDFFGQIHRITLGIYGQ